MKNRVILALSMGAAGYMGYRYYRKKKEVSMAKGFQRTHSIRWKPPSRDQNIRNLINKGFDLLVIGGGASGSGCALDATTRGLKVALVEYGDFSSETSSKSTKLLHGGVRYLEGAMKKFSLTQLKLVFEALRERKRMLHISPYLTKPLPIMLPFYQYSSVPYFFAGLVLYDWISGDHSLGRSFLMGKHKTLESFPNLKEKGLKGSVVYYDAQQNDSRNNLMIALTSAYYGATVSNYVEVVDFVKKDGRILGARCRDRIAGRVFNVYARGVINATGPFTDTVRLKDGEGAKIMEHSSGTHVVLPESFAPKNMGLIDPDTTDNRVLFFVPWRGKAIVGTTETRCKLERGITPTTADIEFILKNIKEYISKPETLTKQKILAAWCGIRPLVRDLKSKNTKAIARNHTVHVDSDGLISLAGGKWTTYRKMAEDAIDKAIEVFKLKPKRGCISKYVKIIGGNGYTTRTSKWVSKKLNVPKDIGMHLTDMYGIRALKLKKYSKNNQFNYLSNKYLFLKEEVEYSVDNEMAVKGHDILVRRTGLGLIDVKEAKKCVGVVCDILGKKLMWSKKQRKQEEKETYECLKSFGLGII